MSTINCKKCGQNFSDENNFCPNCGAEVPTVTYCRNCGNRVENTTFCTSCGCSMNGPQPQYQGPMMNNNYNQPYMNYQAPRPTCGMAVLSMVFGIISFFCFSIFASIPAIILGFISLSKIKKQNLSGTGYAITGIVTGIIETLFTIFIAIIIIVPLFFNDLPEETKMECCSKAHGEYHDSFCFGGDDTEYDLGEYYTCILDVEDLD